jgi:hypothetical protein
MQFGPFSRMPASRQIPTISDCRLAPSPPRSAKPPSKIAAALTPFAASGRKFSRMRVWLTQKATTEDFRVFRVDRIDSSLEADAFGGKNQRSAERRPPGCAENGNRFWAQQGVKGHERAFF